MWFIVAVIVLFVEGLHNKATNTCYYAESLIENLQGCLMGGEVKIERTAYQWLGERREQGKLKRFDRRGLDFMLAQLVQKKRFYIFS